MEAKTAADVLKAARDLLAKDGGWTQGQYARDIEGFMVPETSPLAVCFCADGALFRARSAEDADFEALTRAEDALLKAAGVQNIVHWNDAPERTQAEVVALFDAAIAKAS